MRWGFEEFEWEKGFPKVMNELGFLTVDRQVTREKGHLKHRQNPSGYSLWEG